MFSCFSSKVLLPYELESSVNIHFVIMNFVLITKNTTETIVNYQSDNEPDTY